MKFYMVNQNGESKAFEFPEDYRMDELFCQITGIADDVSDEEVHTKMAESDLSLSTKNGSHIRFCDHANGTTTLSQLGISGDTEYRLSGDYAADSFTGAK